MHKLIIFLFLFFPFTSSFSQNFSKDYWHNGEVDLSSGTTIEGKVKYDLAKDVIIIDEQGISKSFSAANVLAFQFKDALTGKVRYFFSIPADLGNGYVRKHFFELIEEGKVSFLVREAIIRKYDPGLGRWGPTMGMVYYMLDYDFFFLDESGTITQIIAKKEEQVFSYFPSMRKELKLFVKKNKLQLRKLGDMRKLVAFYNNR